MQNEFEINIMGELKLFLGLQIKQESDAIFIHQIKYVKELLKNLKLDKAKETNTSMNPTTSLGLDESSVKVDNTVYRQIIGSLVFNYV